MAKTKKTDRSKYGVEVGEGGGKEALNKISSPIQSSCQSLTATHRPPHTATNTNTTHNNIMSSSTAPGRAAVVETTNTGAAASNIVAVMATTTTTVRPAADTNAKLSAATTVLAATPTTVGATAVATTTTTVGGTAADEGDNNEGNTGGGGGEKPKEGEEPEEYDTGGGEGNQAHVALIRKIVHHVMDQKGSDGYALRDDALRGKTEVIRHSAGWNQNGVDDVGVDEVCRWSSRFYLFPLFSSLYADIYIPPLLSYIHIVLVLSYIKVLRDKSGSAIINLVPGCRESRCIIRTLRTLVAPLHRFEVGRDLFVQYQQGGQVTWYPAQIRKRPEKNGGKYYEVKYYDEKDPFNILPEAINTVEEIEFQELIDEDTLHRVEKLRILRGSVRVQVSQQIDDHEAHYDENNFYYYCLNSGSFFTQARDSVIQEQRNWIDEKVLDSEFANMRYNADKSWVQVAGTKKVLYRGDGRPKRKEPRVDDEGDGNDNRRVRRR